MNITDVVRYSERSEHGTCVCVCVCVCVEGVCVCMCREREYVYAWRYRVVVDWYATGREISNIQIDRGVR